MAMGSREEKISEGIGERRAGIQVQNTDLRDNSNRLLPPAWSFFAPFQAASISGSAGWLVCMGSRRRLGTMGNAGSAPFG